MKPFVAMLTVVALLLATSRSSAGETGSSKAAHFISRGRPLTGPELATINQQAAKSRVSLDAGGEMESSSSFVLVFVAVIACGGVVIYVSAGSTTRN